MPTFYQKPEIKYLEVFNIHSHLSDASFSSAKTWLEVSDAEFCSSAM